MEISDQDILEVNLINNAESKSVTIDSDESIELIVKALSSKTRRKILTQIRQNGGLDVSKIASKLEMTEANISAQIKKLEEAKLIECNYKSGHHGVRKISQLKYDKIIINF